MITVHPHDLKPAMAQTAFVTLGLGALPYLTEAKTVRKINGDCCLTLVYPEDQPGAELLIPDRLLACENQLYRISRIQPRDGKRGRFVSVEAPHVAYDLDEIMIENLETKEDSRYPALPDPVLPPVCLHLNHVLSRGIAKKMSQPGCHR